MKATLFFLVITTLAIGCTPTSTTTKSDFDPLQFVDPFIGTGFHGHTFPGATVPFGMVQLSPDTHIMGWDASSGYHYEDSTLYGFSHTHLSGTGIGDMGDVLLLPYSNTDQLKPVGTFDKNDESATPGYYKVQLNNFGVTAELTATKRVGFHRYSYKNAEERKVMLNLGHILQPNWGHRIIENSFRKINDRTFEGVQKTSGWASDHLIAYRIEFAEPVENFAVYSENEKTDKTELSGRDIQVYMQFASSKEPLLVKVALSVADEKGAAQNLQAELPGWDFETTVDETQKEWRAALHGIEISTDDEEVKTNFYTALYHSMMSPFTYQDVDGRYRGMDKSIKTAPEGFTNYSVFSLWDTFRAFHPLMTIIRPGKAGEWAGSLVQKYLEGGLLPKWPLASNYTGTMVGYPATSVLADALTKGLVPEADLKTWLEAAVTSSTYQAKWLEKVKGTREENVMSKHIYFKEKYGFVPADSISESVSWGVEMAYYDWCIGKIAEAAGDEKTAALYFKNAENYKLYFDESTGFMRGKNSDGSWRTPFHPRFSEHEKSDYVEGNAYQWSYFVPHDIENHIKMYGGKNNFEIQLDTLFTTSSEIEGENASGDITGLIGQYAHGNEPSHHMAYLYNWTNSGWKTQNYLDQILYDFYLPTPAGIIGNEDCGQMSAWYVLSAIGFYQVCPGDPTYTIGRPLVDTAKIQVPGGVFEIVAHNNSRDNKFVEKVVLNGTALEEPFFSHSDLMKGGKLEFFMSAVHE
ncbi:GH92 family glycosyl hydrolase [Prolixibacteraceae bacterium Z1-6]|uniref:GH92 family glycosyl hydrolase n=1 Tax=Draconibacterium aestuarii TaxID=2998507 RepID=A0A9X3J4S7_9BACT|nr:GH92 family glycosyl hydrolase [Prolixibacteraceae bacterium Z1-6]